MDSVLIGTVIHGKKRGKPLGFPTANFIFAQEGIEEGIWVSLVQIEETGLWLSAVTFIGAAETFDESDVKVETYILDFEGDLYGKKLSVKLLSKLRENKRFDSVDALVAQIEDDATRARAYFQNTSR